MIPDKIYIADNVFPTHIDWDGSPINTKRIESSDIEYVRKDTLLEWLKMAVECYSHPDTVIVVDTIRCEGKKWAFQDVINKIESL